MPMPAFKMVRRIVLLGALALTGSLGTGAAAAQATWQKIGSTDGIDLERRSSPGTSFYELRATARTSAPPQAVLDAIWNGVFEDLPATVRKRQVIKRSEHELVFYDQIRAPLVSDRDYTLRFWRAEQPPAGQEAPAGSRWLLFETANTLGPPPVEGHVRVPLIRGAWAVSSDGSGGSVLIYTCYSEPGGSIPAWVARGPQKDQFLFDMRRALRRAAERTPR
jgi:hypothetical protein